METKEVYFNAQVGYRICQFKALKFREQGQTVLETQYQTWADEFAAQLDADVLDKLQWELVRAQRKWRKSWLAEVSK